MHPSENPKLPEGINASEKSPLKDFFILTLGLGVLMAILVLSLSLAITWIAPYIPFSYERAAGEKISLILADEAVVDHGNADNDTEHRLQRLADELASVQNIPEDMQITVHYVDDQQVNAFASLGGQIFIYKGLMQKLESENALAMVLAHEIAHIKFRHPIVALTRGAGLGLTMSLISSATDENMAVGVLSRFSLISSMKFSREQELAADEQAIRTLNQYYGHINGASSVFRVLLAEQDKTINTPPEFLLTHPLSQKRLQTLKQVAIDNHWSLEGSLTPLSILLR